MKRPVIVARSELKQCHMFRIVLQRATHTVQYKRSMGPNAAIFFLKKGEVIDLRVYRYENKDLTFVFLT